MKYLSLVSLFLSSSAFAAPIFCQSLDENVGGGNIQIEIGTGRSVRDGEGHMSVMFPITATNQSGNIRNKRFDAVGTANGNSIELTVVQEGDIAVGFISAKLNRRNGNLDGKVQISGITSSLGEEVSCVTAQ